jgi:antibiotic biosynthesis monooxygenase (ABM) superfamily enzyme
MIERHVTFEVFPEQCAEFEKFFVESYRPAMSSMKGFVRVDLLVEQANPNRYQMVIRFMNSDDSDAWKSSPEHKALSPRLKAMYGDIHADVYEVVA